MIKIIVIHIIYHVVILVVRLTCIGGKFEAIPSTRWPKHLEKGREKDKEEEKMGFLKSVVLLLISVMDDSH